MGHRGSAVLHLPEKKRNSPKKKTTGEKGEKKSMGNNLQCKKKGTSRGKEKVLYIVSKFLALRYSMGVCDADSKKHGGKGRQRPGGTQKEKKLKYVSSNL